MAARREQVVKKVSQRPSVVSSSTRSAVSSTLKITAPAELQRASKRIMQQQRIFLEVGLVACIAIPPGLRPEDPGLLFAAPSSVYRLRQSVYPNGNNKATPEQAGLVPSDSLHRHFSKT
jgi:hypothetical protein